MSMSRATTRYDARIARRAGARARHRRPAEAPSAPRRWRGSLLQAALDRLAESDLLIVEGAPADQRRVGSRIM